MAIGEVRNMKIFYKTDYKGKWFVIQDELFETDVEIDIPVGKITKKEALEPKFIEGHLDACEWYGIPAYIGKDKDMLKVYK